MNNDIKEILVKEKLYSKIDEKVYTFTVENGLKVTIIKKDDYQNFVCAIQTNFGSQSQHFEVQRDGKTTEYFIPQGVAHFLEHKLFTEKNGEDASYAFQKLGLDCNAYTGFLNTTYYFQGSSNLNDGLIMLLDFVQSPYFTNESVEKEKGIIAQELNMYLDKPSNKLYYGLLENMFSAYPIRFDVGGTVAEISKIDKDILYTCYDIFYHPSNMDLVICGDVNIEEIKELIINNQRKKKFPSKQVVTLLFEDDKINKKIDECHMDVGIPKCSIGFKFPFSKTPFYKNKMELDLKVSLISYFLFGFSTKFYQKLLDDGIVSGSLSKNTHIDDYTGFFTLSCDTENPLEFIKRVKKQLSGFKNRKLSLDELKRNVRLIYGQSLKRLNSIEAIAFNYLDMKAYKEDYFDLFTYLDNITIDDIKESLKYFDWNNSTIFIIYPLVK